MQQDQIRADQQAYARQVEGTLHRPVVTRKPLKSANAPKGHEAFLKALEASGQIVSFEKASSGERVVGKIKTSDKYTISVITEAGTRVLFKHDVSEFFAPRQTSAETN
jgi:sRNA-binding regulator protein Hfq